MHSSTPSKELTVVKWLVAFDLGVCILLAIVATWHWPVISDASFMHYVLTLINHGMVPYKDITDINLPGTYFTEWFATRIFGNTAVGWRLVDFTLVLIIAVSLVAATQRRYFPGLVATALFALIHWSDGPAALGQRDLIMTALLVLGYASLLQSVRRQNKILATVGGCLLGCASTIKPQAAFFGVALLALCAIALRRRDQRYFPYLLTVGSCLMLPIVVVATVLYKAHALTAFLTTMRSLDVFHAELGRHSLAFLLAHAIPSTLLPLAVFAFCSALMRRRFQSFEGASLLLGLLFGVCSFCLQGKAYPYQRYPLLVFLLMFVALEVFEWVGQHRASRFISLVATLYLGIWIAPAAVAKTLRYNWRDQYSLNALTADLNELGGQRLSGKVQCLDTTAGCITVLDRMTLTQSTGLLYDCYVFAPQKSAAKEAVREDFWKRIHASPPSILIITDQWCFNLPSGYAKLSEWPQFSQYLDEMYSLSFERKPEPGGYRHLATWPFGYRIYKLNH